MLNEKTIAVPTATLLVAYTYQDQLAFSQFQELAERLARELGQPVIPCSLDSMGNPVLDGIREGLRQGAVNDCGCDYMGLAALVIFELSRQPAFEL